MTRYIHDEEAHNLSSPKKIVPVLMELINPESVVDVGCGIGTFLYQFKQAGVREVLGIDGSWVNRSLLSKYLDHNEFMQKDLELPLAIERKFDLVICMEVVEHLKKSSADIITANLTSLGNIILFSAAPPFQGGQNHVNEQWLSYWQEKFLRRGYMMHDVLRTFFWDDPEVDWWYKQNMVLVAHGDDPLLPPDLKKSAILNIIHPRLYLSKSRVVRGDASPGFYLNLFLKSILKRLGLYKKDPQEWPSDYQDH